jgi:FkbM family methyltransferase
VSLEVVDTPFGKFQIDPQDIIGSTTKAGTLWDGPGFLQVIAKEYAEFSDWGQVILDVGANIGTFSIYCAHRGAWRVVAVEPVDPVHRQLLANCDLNRQVCADAVVTLQVAGYDHTTTLGVPEVDPGNQGGTPLYVLPKYDTVIAQTVKAEPLDHYRYLYGSHVSLIKIDAQGCDGAALFGLQQTIKRDHPAIVFEWEPPLAVPHGHDLVDTIAMLNSLGYTVHEWPSHSWNYLAIAERHGNR